MFSGVSSSLGSCATVCPWQLLPVARSSSLNRRFGTARRCCCSWKRKRSTAGDRDFEPSQVATTAKAPLSVGGLLAVGVSGDCVEASFSDESFDRRHGRSYPGPVWVDICCDAPRVV